MQCDVNILLVEDNPLDVIVFNRSIKNIGSAVNVVHAFDGVEALSIVKGAHDTKTIVSPYLILLDINMPRMNGHEFLDRIRNGEEDPTAVVIIFTTSSNPREVQAAYERGANEYIVKPTSKEGMDNILKAVCNFWRICQPPCRIQ